MSQSSKASKAKVVELLKNSLELYQRKQFRDCLKKYEAILSIINPTDNNIIKAVLFALISQVYFKIFENETIRTNVLENSNLLKLTIPTNQLLRNSESFSGQIEDTESGVSNIIFNSGQIEDPPIGTVQYLIDIFGN